MGKKVEVADAGDDGTANDHEPGNPVDGSPDYHALRGGRGPVDT